MKKLITLLAILTLGITAFAQDDEKKSKDNEIQTIVGKNNAIGGYGAISLQYTEIQDRDAFVFGARGAIVIGHMMSMGLTGTGFFNDAHAYTNGLGETQDISLAGGYGGFFFEPVLFSKFPVHVAIPVTIGAGGVGVVSDKDNDNGDIWDNEYESQGSDAFMVIEPGIEVELNVTRFFRFCVGGYYRYTSHVDIPEFDIPTGILKGFSGGVTFKFGRF